MTEIAETAPIARSWCPTCEAHVNPLTEIVTVQYCSEHVPSMHGTQTVPGRAVYEHQEAGGASNRAWCDFFHRGIITPVPIPQESPYAQAYPYDEF